MEHFLTHIDDLPESDRPPTREQCLSNLADYLIELLTERDLFPESLPTRAEHKVQNTVQRSETTPEP